MFASKQELHWAISSIDYCGGGTRTGAALRQARIEMFQKRNGARRGQGKHNNKENISKEKYFRKDYSSAIIRSHKNWGRQLTSAFKM